MVPGRKKRTNRGNKDLLGQITRSQAISTYGPGGIFELRKSGRHGNSLNSVMICGIDRWKMEESEKIVEPTLAKSLHVGGFRAPPPVTDQPQPWAVPKSYVEAIRFPKWLVCNKCDRLGTVDTHFRDSGKQPICSASSCGGRGVPVRLVSACFGQDGDSSQPGHIDDFPWVEWAHSYSEGSCANPQLKLLSTGDSVGLAGLRVTCFSNECNGKVGRSLQDVFGEHALRNIKCTGKRPWLNDDQSGCKRPIRALMRGASNVYFPVTASVLSIPPNSSQLVGLIGKVDRTILSMWGEGKVEDAIRYFRQSQPRTRRYSDEQINDAFIHVLGDQEDIAPATEREQRMKERVAMVEGRSDEDEEGSDFCAHPVQDDDVKRLLYGTLKTIVLLERLREVRALRGFQRINRTFGDDSYSLECSPIFNNDPGWLPAIEVRGEGIYFELDQAALAQWADLEVVRRRLSLIHRNLSVSAENEGRSLGDEDLPSAKFILMHTFSHLVMNQLSLLCGYSSASLRERLYVDDEENCCGVLIYTSAPGADGTLGGLVRQGRPNHFDMVLKGALEESIWCSSDPLCSDSRGQGPGASNLAACHACCLVSETSCEHNNTLLDRGFVVGIPEERTTGFFAPYLFSTTIES